MTPLMHWFASDGWRHSVEALLQTLWIGAVLAGVLLLALRRSTNPFVRYWCCILALTGVLVGGLGSWTYLEHRAGPPGQNGMSSFQVTWTGSLEIQPHSSIPEPGAVPTFERISRSAPLISTYTYGPLIPSNSSAYSWMSLLALLWLMGTTVMLIRSIGCVGWGEKLRRATQPLQRQDILELIEQARRQLKLARRIHAVVTDRLTSPAVVGILVPTLVLPASLLTTIPAHQLQLILLHELAHIRRGDYLVNVLQLFAEAVLFFNPAVWWISRQIRQEREACCDAMAIALVDDRAEYARTLTQVAQQTLRAHLATASAFATEHRPGGLKDRIQRLLVPEYHPAVSLSWKGLAGAVLLGGSLLLFPMSVTSSTCGVATSGKGAVQNRNTPIQSLPRLPDIAAGTIPSLGSHSTDAGDAIFHFKGMIDGADRILFARNGARWEHVNWAWPQDVTVNGVRWNVQEQDYLTTADLAGFLPESYSLDSAELEVIEGRDIVALEHTDQGLVVNLNDTPVGASEYEFKIHFHRIQPSFKRVSASTVATLKIAAEIDGSDCVQITSEGAAWTHKSWGFPGNISVNGIPWDPRQRSFLVNAGATAFLPAGVDFSTARVISRKGRDLVTLRSDKEGVWVSFADNPNGSDHYEIEIAFGD
ncbi:MAG: M56 family metallopeptidase [Verrucomicrobiia bacterium]